MSTIVVRQEIWWPRDSRAVLHVQLFFRFLTSLTCLLPTEASLTWIDETFQAADTLCDSTVALALGDFCTHALVLCVGCSSALATEAGGGLRVGRGERAGRVDVGPRVCRLARHPIDSGCLLSRGHSCTLCFEFRPQHRLEPVLDLGRSAHGVRPGRGSIRTAAAAVASFSRPTIRGGLAQPAYRRHPGRS